MKFVIYDDGRPGLLRDDGVVDISPVTGPLGASNGQAAMEAIITHIDDIRTDLTRLQSEGNATPLSSVTLQSPLPAPNKWAAWEKCLAEGHYFGTTATNPPLRYCQRCFTAWSWRSESDLPLNEPIRPTVMTSNS